MLHASAQGALLKRRLVVREQGRSRAPLPPRRSSAGGGAAGAETSECRALSPHAPNRKRQRNAYGRLAYGMHAGCMDREGKCMHSQGPRLPMQ